MPSVYQVKNTARARQIIQVLIGHGFGHFLDRLNLEQVPGIGRIVVRMRRKKVTGVSVLDRARMALEELGPSFIKLGQLMASRPDLVSPEVAQAFSDLRDNVPPFSGDEALAIIEGSLPGVTTTFFSSIDPEPKAAASIAQVHFAVLSDGTRVAVKVRRPDICEIVETDINILFILARLAEKYLPEIAIYQPVGVVREFARAIRQELDFTLEASSIERFSENFERDKRVVVPRVFWEATTSNVLTIEKLAGGVAIDDPEGIVEAGSDPTGVARNLFEIFMEQVLEDGYFHGDPHGGNVVVLENGQIGFMDFGIVGQLDRDLRRSLGTIFLGMVDFNLDRVVKEYLKMGMIGEEVDLSAFKSDLRDFIRPYYGLPLKRLPLGEIMFQSMQITMRHHIRVPPDMILLGKSWLTLEGVIRRLDPDLNLLELSRPYAVHVIGAQFNPGELVKRLKDIVEDYSDLAGMLPQQINQILGKVIRGKLRIDFFHTNLENLIREMDRSANRLSFSLIISATIIGSTLIIITGRGFKVFGYPILGLAGFLFAGVLGVWLVIAILRSGRL